MSGTTTPVRRRFRFFRPLKLRTLLLLISVAGLLFGWEANRLRRRAEAVALLEEWHLEVTEENACLSDLPSALLGDRACDWFSHWRRRYAAMESSPVRCGTPPLSPREEESSTERANPELRKPTFAERKRLVAALATLTELRCIQISWELDDDDLRTLSSLKNLGILGFQARQLTDAGARHLDVLSKLEAIVLNFDRRDRLPVGAIAALNGLPGLQRLLINRPLRPDDLAIVKAAMPNVSIEAE